MTDFSFRHSSFISIAWIQKMLNLIESRALTILHIMIWTGGRLLKKVMFSEVTRVHFIFTMKALHRLFARSSQPPRATSQKFPGNRIAWHGTTRVSMRKSILPDTVIIILFSWWILHPYSDFIENLKKTRKNWFHNGSYWPILLSYTLRTVHVNVKSPRKCDIDHKIKNKSTLELELTFFE